MMLVLPESLLCHHAIARAMYVELRAAEDLNKNIFFEPRKGKKIRKKRVEKLRNFEKLLMVPLISLCVHAYM